MVCDQALGESAGRRAGWFLNPVVLRPVDTLSRTYIETLVSNEQAYEALNVLVMIVGGLYS